MKSMRLIWKIIKLCKLDKIVYAFLIEFLVVSFLLWRIEPGITTFGEGLWYTFVACTSIGFGDIVPTTILGRILTIVVTLHEILIIGVIPGIVVNYYQEIVQMRVQETASTFIEKLEHLPDLSHEELQELSNKIKRMKR